MPDATLKEVRDYFEMPSQGFASEWKALSETDKADLKVGIGNGTLTY